MRNPVTPEIEAEFFTVRGNPATEAAKKKVREAAALRPSRAPFDHWFPSGEDRIYLPFTREMGPKDKWIVDWLGQKGYEDVDYEKGLAGKPGGRMQKIGKILNRMTKTSDYAKKILRAFENSKYRVLMANKSEEELVLVVSKNIDDIAYMSTDRAWDHESCMRLPKIDSKKGGMHHKDVYCEIADGALVAYLIDSDDINIERPLARIKIRRFDSRGRRQKVSFAVPEESVYGHGIGGFVRAVKRFLSDKQGVIITGKYAYKGGKTSDTFERGSMRLSPLLEEEIIQLIKDEADNLASDKTLERRRALRNITEITLAIEEDDDKWDAVFSQNRSSIDRITNLIYRIIEQEAQRGDKSAETVRQAMRTLTALSRFYKKLDRGCNLLLSIIKRQSESAQTILLHRSDPRNRVIPWAIDALTELLSIGACSGAKRYVTELTSLIEGNEFEKLTPWERRSQGLHSKSDQRSLDYTIILSMAGLAGSRAHAPIAPKLWTKEAVENISRFRPRSKSEARNFTEIAPAIWENSKNNSEIFINELIDRVDNNSKYSIEYIRTIITFNPWFAMRLEKTEPHKKIIYNALEDSPLIAAVYLVMNKVGLSEKQRAALINYKIENILEREVVTDYDAISIDLTIPGYPAFRDRPEMAQDILKRYRSFLISTPGIVKRQKEDDDYGDYDPYALEAFFHCLFIEEAGTILSQARSGKVVSLALRIIDSSGFTVGDSSHTKRYQTPNIAKTNMVISLKCPLTALMKALSNKNRVKTFHYGSGQVRAIVVDHILIQLSKRLFNKFSCPYFDWVLDTLMEILPERRGSWYDSAEDVRHRIQAFMNFLLETESDNPYAINLSDPCTKKFLKKYGLDVRRIYFEDTPL